MNGLLLDTHAFLWLTTDRSKMSPATLALLLDPETVIWFSAVTSWEISVKRAKQQLEFVGSPAERARRVGLQPLDITAEHCEASAALPLLHRDPFDRLLVAQAQLQALTLVTRDTAMGRYGVAVLAV